MQQWLYRVLRRKQGTISYIPAVDGLRFIAISMVFLQHAFTTYQLTGFPSKPLPSFLHAICMNGYKGVHLFFVISGFILSIPFAQRFLKGTREVHIGPYYKRRLFRLEPPYFIAMTACFLLIYYLPLFRQTLPVVYQHAGFRELLPHYVYSLLYQHNTVYGTSSIINFVTWSLEIEVQFYVLAPLFFQLFRLNAVTRRSIVVLLAASVVLVQQYIPPQPLTLVHYLQYFLAGMLLGDLYVMGWPQFVNHTIMFPLAAAAFLLVWALPETGHHLDHPLLVLPAFILVACILGNAQLSRLLSLKGFTIIGGMCYTIYLWHAQIMWVVAHYTGEWMRGANDLVHFTIQLLFYAISVLAICTLLYLVAERPFMSLRDVRKRPQDVQA